MSSSIGNCLTSPCGTTPWDMFAEAFLNLQDTLISIDWFDNDNNWINYLQLLLVGVTWMALEFKFSPNLSCRRRWDTITYSFQDEWNWDVSLKWSRWPLYGECQIVTAALDDSFACPFTRSSTLVADEACRWIKRRKETVAVLVNSKCEETCRKFNKRLQSSGNDELFAIHVLLMIFNLPRVSTHFLPSPTLWFKNANFIHNWKEWIWETRKGETSDNTVTYK